MPARGLTTRRRTPAAAALGAVLVLVLAGCATGFNAETNRMYAPAIGTNARIGEQVDVLNALFVTNPDGTATLAGTALASDAEGDTITAASVSSEDGEVEVALEEPIELSPGESVRLGEQDPLVVLEGDFIPGQFVRLTLTFARAGDLSFDAVIDDRTEEYSEIDAPPIVTATTEPTEPTDEPSTEPTDEPTS